MCGIRTHTSRQRCGLSWPTFPVPGASVAFPFQAFCGVLGASCVGGGVHSFPPKSKFQLCLCSSFYYHLSFCFNFSMTGQIRSDSCTALHPARVNRGCHTKVEGVEQGGANETYGRVHCKKKHQNAHSATAIKGTTLFLTVGGESTPTKKVHPGKVAFKIMVKKPGVVNTEVGKGSHEERSANTKGSDNPRVGGGLEDGKSKRKGYH